jgi:hypothetical protein
VTSAFAFDDVPFERRLAETIAWCASRARADDPKLSLRSDELRPGVLESDRASAVRTVVTWRMNHLGTASIASGGLAGGRLAIYFPDRDLSDGAAEAASRGFFDVHNAPPWDTWIALADEPARDISSRQYVVYWVPPVLIACANAGIEVNPEECIAWLDNADVAARDEVRQSLRR